MQKFTCDNRGNLKTLNYGYGFVINNYDAWNRLISTVYPSITSGGVTIPEKHIQPEYTHFIEGLLKGKRTTTRELVSGIEVGKVVVETDPLGRKVKETWSIPNENNVLETYSLAFSNNALGSITSMLYPGDNAYDAVNYVYSNGNNDARLHSISGFVTSIQYSKNGFLKQIEYGNQATTTITPDIRFRPQEINTTHNNTEIFRATQQTFEYDDIDRLTKAHHSNVYHYNDKYDGSGNRKEFEDETNSVIKNYQYTGHRLMNISGGDPETFTYNAIGGIETRLKDGIFQTYVYDSVGKLLEVRQGSTVIAQYVYDPYGRLVRTKEGNTYTYRLPIGNETAYEKIVEGLQTTERRYILGLGRHIARQERVSGVWQNTTYYHGDHLGSTRALSGAEAGTFTYDPFGVVVGETGTTATTTIAFLENPWMAQACITMAPDSMTLSLVGLLVWIRLGMG